MIVIVVKSRAEKVQIEAPALCGGNGSEIAQGLVG